MTRTIKPFVKNLVLTCWAASTFFASAAVGTEKPDDDSRAKNAKSIFEDRIMPIFRSPDPSSCVQCHLSSVDLKNYILPSHEKTFASLRDQGLIDLNAPENSKILKLIKMGDQDADKGARMIHAKMRDAELEAFADWVKASCADESMRGLPSLNPAELAKPAEPDEVIRHARKSRVVDSFVRNVWSQRMRCFPCHTPSEIGPNQKNAREKFNQWEEQYGDQMLIFKKTPEATLDHWIRESAKVKAGQLPMLNLADPAQSLVVVKPTSKLPPKQENGERIPTYAAPVYHMGGLKMHLDDHSYKSFVAWISDYANVTSGKYAKVDDLPADNWHPTQNVLRLRDVPEAWEIGTPVQLMLFGRSDDKTGWSNTPIAFTQGTITPKYFVNGPLILLRPTEPTEPGELEAWRTREDRLPSGEFLVKVYVDAERKLSKDPTLMLGSSDFRGDVIGNPTEWQRGFKNATWVSAKAIESKVHDAQE